MVFESLVADLLNKYLGEYVANLDRSQLKIGIWGGDVVLRDLSLKDTALDDLQLPIKTVNGFLGKLTLKIPWKNLYKEPVEACIEDLYLLVAPSTEMKYDAEKEERWKQDAKQAQLRKVEEAQKIADEGEKKKVDNTFAEKLAAQIVRNIEIRIKNIHIRYEDRVYSQGKPYALGVTMHNLVVTTTNSEWQPCISQDAEAMIYKILKLEGLSVYLNSHPKMNFLDIQVKEELLKAFQNHIVKDNPATIPYYKYMLGPLNATSKLQINQKPENYDYEIPKVLFNLELPILQIKISKSQYCDLLVLLESIDRMARAAPYRKYRPNVTSYSGNAKQWWKYAYLCILEEEVKRKRVSWEIILKHRTLVKKYSGAYKEKLITSRPPAHVVETCQTCEKELDVMNILLVRRRIELEVDRQGAVRQQQSSGGWFSVSSWWGGGSKQDTSPENESVIMKQFTEALTPAEREKLNKAIGYEEGQDFPDSYPPGFVATDLNFYMSRLEVEVSDEDTQVLFGAVTKVKAKLQQRPMVKNFEVTVEMGLLDVLGLQQGDIKPVLVDSKNLNIHTASGSPLFSVSFVKSPDDAAFDQRIYVTVLPIHFTYDALTFNKVVDVFSPEKKADIKHLHSVASVKIEEFKRMSSLGLQYAIEKHPRLDIKVDIMGFYGVIPFGGIYKKSDQAQLIVHLGKFLFTSTKRETTDAGDVKTMHLMGTSQTEIMETMLNRSYDRFVINFDDAQVKMILPGESTHNSFLHIKAKESTTSEENYQQDQGEDKPDQYILKPISLKINLDKSLFPDDPRLPKIKVYAELPSINFRIAETRLLNLISLLVSIPLPEFKEREPEEANLYSSQMSINVAELARSTQLLELKKSHDTPTEDVIQFTELEAKFRLNEVVLAVFRTQGEADVPLGEFRALSLEAEMTQTTYDLNVVLRLGGLSLNQDYENEKIQIINTPMAEGIDDYLFVVSYFNVGMKNPELHTKHRSVVQKVEMDFSRLDVLVYQEPGLDVIQWANKLKECVDEALNQKKKVPAALVPKKEKKKPSKLPSLPVAHKILDSIREEGNTREVKHTSRRRVVVHVIDLQLKAKLGEISLVLRNKARAIGKMLINGGDAEVTMKRSYTQINASLSNFEFLDLREDILHPKVLSILGKEAALKCQVVLFNLEELSDKDNINMSVTASIACFRVVFLNHFITSLLGFLDNFASAQAAILEASANAVEAAKANVQQAYKEAYRVRLDIRLKAPLILVPANSYSYDAVLVDFGVFTMLNTFQERHVEDGDTTHKAVLDNWHLELEKLKISRVKLDEQLEVSTEYLLLEPITFQLTVQRNLSSDWYHSVPIMDISGGLKSIKVKLTNEDYKKVMEVILQNLGEAPAISAQPSRVKPSVPQATPRNSPTTQRKIIGEIHTADKPQKKKDESVKTTMKFNFTLESLIIEIFKGGDKAIVDACPRRKGDGLARFTLSRLSVEGSMLSNMSMSTNVRLLDCLVDDTRASQIGKINQYMMRKASKKNEHQKSTVEITYELKGDNSKVNMRVCSFILILNMQHIMEIAEFFTPSADDKSNFPRPTQSKSQSGTSILSAGKKSSSLRPEVPAPAPLEEIPEPCTKKMQIQVTFEQPDIILVENMDNINANAIIMNVEVNLTVNMIGSYMSLTGNMKDLQLFSCCFNPERRRETKAKILRKVTLEVFGSTPSSGLGIHLDVKSSKVRLSVSPGTIELLTKVASAITRGKEDVVEKPEVEEDYSNIWNIQKFNEADHWFLKPEEAEEAAVVLQTLEEDAQPQMDEICSLSVPDMLITVEAGVGTKTLPMLALETSIEGRVKNWSSKLSVHSSMALAMMYYNSHLAVWEPLVENVETVTNGKSELEPWKLTMQVETNPEVGQRSKVSTDATDFMDVIPHTKPKMVVSFSSKKTLEMTVTKTSMDVIQQLLSAFKTAIFKPETRDPLAWAPYVVHNHLGMPVTIFLRDTFKLHSEEPDSDSEGVNTVVLEPGAMVNLALVEEEDIKSSVVRSKTALKEKYLKIGLPEMECELDLPQNRADKRYFSLVQRGTDTWGLVSDVQVPNGTVNCYLRSIIQVQNHFNIPVKVYFMTNRGNELELVGTVEPNKYLNLPLQAIYTPTSEFFFSAEGYTVSLTPFVWKDLQKTLAMTKVLQCNAKSTEETGPFFFKVVGELEQVFNELSSRHTIASTCYNIHLRPTVIIKNFLPVDIIVCVQGVLQEKYVPAGHRMQIPTAEPGVSTVVIRIHGYLDQDWSCKHEIAAKPLEQEVWTFSSNDHEHNKKLDLGMHCDMENESLVFSLYCPFWMINKTGKILTYYQSDNICNELYHPPDYKGPVMFSFRAKDFWAKKKACIMVEQSALSDKFSLNVAGSSGLVKCKAEDVVYQIGVHIQLTYNSLTKQVTFTPYHVLVNRCKLPVHIQEVKRPSDDWVKVEAGEVIPFWPKSTEDRSELVVKLGDSPETTIPFLYNHTLNRLLKLNNKHGGVNVDVQFTEGAIYITFTNYKPEMTPALIINHSPYDIPLAEKDAPKNKMLLPAGHQVFFNWSTTSDQHALTFCEKYSTALQRDEIGDFKVSPSVPLFWVTFLDGLQRILLFTENARIARDAEIAGEMEPFDMEVLAHIHGLGLSLVDNAAGLEVLYLGITSPGIIWEARKLDGNKYKPIPEYLSCQIEEAWQTYEHQISNGQQPNNKISVGEYLIDLASKEIQKPTPKILRRTYNHGLWFQYRASPHQVQYHAKINRLQMDNQIYDCVFPVVFAPVPPPKSVNMEKAAKPFAEVSIVQTLNEHTTVCQIKYCKALIQEFHIKVDIGFVNALVKLFEAGATTEEQEAAQFQEDLSLIDKSLISHVEELLSQEQKNFYDYLHFSPLKIHLSFSLSGGGAQVVELPRVLNVLVQSLGVTLTDIHDVVLQLSYFERTCTFLNQNQLVSEVVMHYKGQCIKQFYVLVLGLDCLGNPYGLVVGIKEGVQDLFYEPIQGAIQGPGEFAEGLVLGVRSLLGHTVGGVTGAVSRMTGALGTGLAALTFDEDYQKKRRRNMDRSGTVGETMASGGKGILMGVVEGVGGVFTKPISGAKEEGVGGFMKGLVTGGVGLVTRPTAGIVDFASGSLSAVKRATEMGEEVKRLRNPRHFKSDKQVRPYCKREADGVKHLKSLEKGKYCATDEYVYHTLIGDSKNQDYLLLTDKRLMVYSPNEIFGGNQLEFSYTWGEISEPPTLHPKGLLIKAGEAKKKLFRSSSNAKVIIINNEAERQVALDKMIELMNQNKGTGSIRRTGTMTSLKSPTSPTVTSP